MSAAIDKVTQAINTFYRETGKKPTDLYLGRHEWLVIKASGHKAVSPAEDHTDDRARVLGLRVYVVDAHSHLGVA